MTKKIVLSDDTSHVSYTLNHMSSRVAYERDDFDILCLVRAGSTTPSDSAEAKFEAAKLGCKLHTLDVSRLEPILKGAGLSNLIEFESDGSLKKLLEFSSVLTVVSEHARELGYEAIVLGWHDVDDHLHDVITKVNEALSKNASKRGLPPTAYEVYNLD